MFIYDLINLFIDEDSQEIEIYDLVKSKTVFKGYASDIPDNLLYCEIYSIDNIDRFQYDIVINIELSD